MDDQVVRERGGLFETREVLIIHHKTIVWEKGKTVNTIVHTRIKKRRMEKNEEIIQSMQWSFLG